MEASESNLQIIRDNPIGTSLGPFYDYLSGLVQEHEGTLDTISRKDLQIACVRLFGLLLGHRVLELLPSASGRDKLESDVLRLNSAISHPHFNFDRLKPLLRAVLTKEPDKELLDQVYKAVIEITPRPRPIPSHLGQTPRTKSTGYIHNTLQLRTDMDLLLKEELVAFPVDVLDFHDAFFGHIPGLQAATDAIFKECQQDALLQYRDGKWVGWPEDTDEPNVLKWLSSFCKKLTDMAKGHGLTIDRQLLSFANKYMESASGARRKLDVGFVDRIRAKGDSAPSFSGVYVLGELKRNPNADTAANAWFDNARYVREVFASQDTRRFVLAFTLCGSYMRVWEFDRTGGIGSTKFDINKDGPRFVSTILGFLIMSHTDLGYDPTIKKRDNGERFMEITRNDKPERLILDPSPFLRVPCLVGRATTCWKAHNEESPEETLVIKDSWQYPQREEEGELLRKALASGVTNVAKYYHHETVQVSGQDDAILNNIRRNIDTSRAVKCWPLRLHRGNSSITGEEDGPSSNDAHPPTSDWLQPAFLADAFRSNSRKRLLDNVHQPPSKRSCSLTEVTDNRVHRRIVLCDYGIPIYKASSRVTLLIALESCIKGHKSLLDAHLLHRDISINNLMINEKDPARSFLIDLDLAIDVRRTSISGSKGITGTPAFMAIGALIGEPHTFMHDLESFFWVLLWICVHCNGTRDYNLVSTFERFNYMGALQLAQKKEVVISDRFYPNYQARFTPMYQPLIPCVNKLRKRIFRQQWVEGGNLGLYDDMIEILREAREDPEVTAS